MKNCMIISIMELTVSSEIKNMAEQNKKKNTDIFEHSSFPSVLQTRTVVVCVEKRDMLQYILFSLFCLTFALMGGCWDPLRFFPDCRFWHTLSYIFSAYVVKILDPGHPRSGHQIRQVTTPHKKFRCSSKLRRLNNCLETFSDWYKYKCIKCISHSGQGW